MPELESKNFQLTNPLFTSNYCSPHTVIKFIYLLFYCTSYGKTKLGNLKFVLLLYYVDFYGQIVIHILISQRVVEILMKWIFKNAKIV